MWDTSCKIYHNLRKYIDEIKRDIQFQTWSVYAFCQVVSVDQGGNMAFWLLDTGQRVKSHSDTHPDAEVTSLAQDASGTMLYTGATDGTIKVVNWLIHLLSVS